MKKLLQRIALFLLGMKHAYVSTTNEGDVIIMTSFPLDKSTQYRISKELQYESVEFNIS